ncbi:GDSL esterase/lipase At3g27950-like [Hibiscus syriacus]|uniref:GDSL esterase/lipase At3g27950-like n=1 Tax=Hibiscus syriacus TaxID=106335 RepID=UPI001923107E|nr:GDSL esterase/lipase At3g27950-like [Hibiscus syriacus]
MIMEEQWKVVHLLGMLVLVFAQQWKLVESNAQGSVSCGFLAMYNFGDSNSDTGGISATLNEILPPNGETFFGHPAGRASDGRLIVDFIAESLKLPYLSAYLDSIGTNFRHGANFTTGGSSVRPPGFSPFNLGIQISQFIQFKSRTTGLYNQLSLNRRIPLSISNIPRPAEFSQALYTFDIGQNDLGHGFETMSEKQVLDSIPHIISELAKAIHQLYKEGARFFWIHNTGPLGCLPYNVIYGKKAGNLDNNGCVKSQNEAAMEFNRQLKDKISWLRTQLPFAKLTYVDVYSAKYALISNAKNLGFVDPFIFCCGSFYGYHINCGKKAIVNGTVYGNPCENPSKHVSWDGIHYSQAANMWVSDRILNGSFSDPPVSIQDACHHQIST